MVPAMGAHPREVPLVDGRGPATDCARPLLLDYVRRDLHFVLVRVLLSPVDDADKSYPNAGWCGM